MHYHHICRGKGTVCTRSKSGMTVYQDGIHTVGVGIVIILLCVTNITSNIHLNNQSRPLEEWIEEKYQ